MLRLTVVLGAATLALTVVPAGPSLATAQTPDPGVFVAEGHRTADVTAQRQLPIPTAPPVNYPEAIPAQDPEVPPPPTREGCLAEPDAHVEPSDLGGWYPNRYGWCAFGTLAAPGVDSRNGQVVAEFSTDFIVIGYGNNGARQFDYLVYLEDFRTTGTGVNWDLATVETSFTGCTTGIECPVQSRNATVPQWRLSNTFAVTFTSPEVSGAGDQLVRSRIGLDIRFATPTQPEWIWSDSVAVGESPIRFDSASYVGRARGAIFPDYRLVFTVDTRLSNQDESARHILDALERPELTFPSWLGKSVPGRTTPLTRMFNPADNTANRNKSVDTCRDVYGPWDSTADNCDEYPFASTYEGSKTGPERNGGFDRFSVRLIDPADNQFVGGELLEVNFYRALRVLDQDNFYVNVLH
jgi:hypothetical protein